MAGNYGQYGQDWYNQRLNQIASMMSMQNADPTYLAGALISRYFLKPQIMNYMQNKVIPTVQDALGGGGSDNNTNTTENTITNATIEALSPNSDNLLMTKEEMLNNPIQGYQDLANAGQAYNKQMDFARLGQQQPPEKPPTQAEITEANNNTTNQAVTQEAQNQGYMQGVMPNLNNNTAADTIAARQTAQQQQLAATAAQEDARKRQALQLAMMLNGGMSFDSAPASGKETGANETVLDDKQLQVMQAILLTKQAYAAAQQDNDTESMQKAHDTAEVVRQMAKENGIDLPVSTEDMSVDELTQKIQDERVKQEKQQQEDYKQEAERIRNLTPQELLNNPEINISPNAFYQRAYQDAIRKHIPEDMARQFASDMAMQYEANYMTAMQNDFNTQGINADGSMNAAGIDNIMRMAAANNPQIAQMLMGQYASPRDTWSFNRDIDKARTNEELRERLASYNFNNIDIPRMQYNAELTDRLNANNAARRINATTAAMNAQLEQISRLVNTAAISPEEGKAAVLAMLGLGSGKGSSGRSGNSGNNEGYSMTPKEQIALAGNLGYLMNSALIGAQGSDKDKAQEAVDNYMAEKEKYRAQLIANGDTDSIELLDGFGFVLNFIYAALHGDETHAVEYYKAFRNNPELKAYVSGIDLTKYDRLIEKQIKNEQKKQEQENQDNQDEDENQETYGTATALLRSIT